MDTDLIVLKLYPHLWQSLFKKILTLKENSITKFFERLALP